jgi:acyl carrier protein
MESKPTNETERAVAVASSAVLAAAIKWLKDTHNEEVTETWTWKQLQESGFDSLDQVELLMDVEEQCNCAIEDEWVEDLERKPAATLKEMADVIATHLSS